MKKKVIIGTVVVAAIGVGAYLLMRDPYKNIPVAEKRLFILSALKADGLATETFSMMNDDEIKTVYEFVRDYTVTGLNKVKAGSDLYHKLMVITTKYKIFT